MAAYRKMVQSEGYDDVEISRLAMAAGVPLDDLKVFILKLGRLGFAVLSLGDWSLSSEDVRAGAIEVHGRPNLLVRFKNI